ncbi:GPW/gp25 family protein [Hyphomonas sp. TMED31]|jgi:phage baseplate assembly protein W|uniref:GPW/gp25 family protein n=1 Tax=Hyphomonas sp. TMED31 TaxID=1986606 RepID=UPI000B72E66E|nr:MAG: hypothetical protein CBB91_12365 [Hyphomonas sp. TMED31]|tara:strand:+ start:931 stop:1317 length:387 start_codon:yes stop_codon:yes gene_type:complete
MAVYSDISLSFSKHPATNDIGKITNVNAIINSMRNILTTRLGERPFEPDYGSKIYDTLFELVDFISLDAAASSAREALEFWEPRVEILNVIPISNPDQHEIELTIEFYIVGAVSEGVQETSFVFTSTR